MMINKITLFIFQDSKWKTIEKENPDLFEEAISLVAPDSCDKHTECLKKGGNRYDYWLFLLRYLWIYIFLQLSS